jgi:hypothetical protein
MGQTPARIHVLLARSSPKAVVIRRGPSKEVASMLWDRSTDEFTLGQWLKGRIYERRSDLSPDGSYWIYFAMNGLWESETRGSWTAIAKAPYLKALVCLAKGDCWNGGGLWTERRRYWLNDGYGHTILRDARGLQRDKDYRPAAYYGGECPGVYYLRLFRDGWVEGPEAEEHPAGTHMVFDKPLPGGWTLRKYAHAQTGSPPGKGCYWDEHALVNLSNGKRVPLPDWEWADFDGLRLLWSREGRIFAGDVNKDGISDEKELADLNGMRFKPIKAPYE